MANRFVMKLPVANALGLHVSLKNFAVALRELNRTQRGLDLLLPAAEKVSGEWVIPIISPAIAQFGNSENELSMTQGDNDDDGGDVSSARHSSP